MEVLNGEIAHLALAKREGELPSLENLIFNKTYEIESWFKTQWQKTPPPITSSVDLRYSGFKLAPVDTNLFPAGFNNISSHSLSWSAKVAQLVFSELLSLKKPWRVLLLPEDHTRNLFYFQSLNIIYNILSNAGCEVRIGSLNPEMTEPKQIELHSHQSLVLEPLVRVDNKIRLRDFEPTLLLLNNDLSTEIPHILLNLDQPVMPALKLGWSSRLKSRHFKFYEKIAVEFSELFQIDPWLINPYFSAVDEIDFMAQTGLESLIIQTRKILTQVKEKYTQYKISEKPFVVVKADNGTYGMSVMSIYHEDELKELNRKQRTKMATIKGGGKVNRVLIQEGVYTFEYKSSTAVAEPVVYMIGPLIVGGFYRLHREKGISDNLNSPGMYFEPIDFIVEKYSSPEKFFPCLDPFNLVNPRFYAYSVVARLAALAAGKESQETRESE